MPQIKARLLFRTKRVFSDGAIMEIKAWAVPQSARTPEGVKYSLVYIDVHGNRQLGYDNAEGKGHHRHEGMKETPFEFESIWKLLDRFFDEIRQIRGGYENEDEKRDNWN